MFVLCVFLVIFWGALDASGQGLAEVDQLDLVTAQQIAIAANPSLAAAAERVEQARLRITEVTALYWPSIEALGSATSSMLSANETTRLSTLAGGAAIDRTSERYQLSLRASWLLFDGFSRRFARLVAVYGQQESVEARRDGMRLLLQSVAESYYGAQLALYNKDIAEADFSFNLKQAKEAQVSMDAGAGSLSAVLNFQVQMNNASTEILVAERDYDLALFGLAVLLGRDSGKMPDGLTLVPMDMVRECVPYAVQSEPLFQAALRYRPDLLGQQFKMERTRSTVEVNRASFYPRLSLNGSLEGNRLEDAGLGGDDVGSTVQVSLSYNLFKGGGDRARVAEAKSRQREAARTLKQRQNKIYSEVRQAITRLEQARAQLRLQRVSVQLVEQSRDLVQEGYKAGQESLARLNEVQRDLVRTQSRLALSLISLYVHRQSLQTATGESLIPYLTARPTAGGMY